MGRLTNLLGLNNTSQTATPSVPISNNKQEGETYQQWGFRMAGLSMGKPNSLDPHLQIVYTTIKKEQEENAELQDELQKNLLKQIASEETALAQEQNNLEQTKKHLLDIKGKIETISSDISELRKAVAAPNKEAKINLIIGLCILIPLTIYLFVFYSSTSYSAFMGGDDGIYETETSVTKYIINPRALLYAWNNGIVPFLFIIFLPFIFLALGFVLHQFGKQNGYSKYFKMAGIILVTFIFDCIIAYKIDESIYKAESMTILTERPPYSIPLAIQDVGFWAVIFCGFLAYIIWGLLFGFVMESYNKLDANKIERQNLEQQLKVLQQNENTEEQKQTNIANKITAIEGNIKQHELDKTNKKRYDINKILLEQNHFFAGWLQYMNGGNKPKTEIDDATNKFNSFINSIKIQFNYN